MKVKYNLQKLKRQLEVIQTKHLEEYRKVEEEVAELNILVKEENKVVQDKLEKVLSTYTKEQLRDMVVEKETKTYTTKNFFGWETEHSYTTEKVKDIITLPEPLTYGLGFNSSLHTLQPYRRIMGGGISWERLVMGMYEECVYSKRWKELQSKNKDLYLSYATKDNYFIMQLKHCPAVKKLQDKVLHLESIGITEVVLGDEELTLLLPYNDKEV